MMLIERLNHRGEGIATGNAYPQTLPGEEIELREDGSVRNLAPSPDRITPPCSHFKQCGGCALQHASDTYVAEWKRDFIAQALAGRGIEAEVLPTITSPPRSRRRAEIAGKRTKKGVIVGFHKRGSDQIIEIPNCHLIDPALLAALPPARELTLIGASRKGFIRLLATVSEAGIDLAVSDAKPVERQQLAELAAIAERHDLARLSWNGEVVVTRRPPTQQFGRARVVPPEGGFLQATKAGETSLAEAVIEICKSAKNIADLFAGCGTFSLPLAEIAAVHSVEGDAAASEALDQAWRGTEGLKPVSTETRDLFRRPLMPDELKNFDAVVLDPPRAGAEAQITELAQSAVPTIAMVSCNPLTFARDAATLIASGYCIGPVQPVDQFRWSPHVELVAGFTWFS